MVRYRRLTLLTRFVICITAAMFSSSLIAESFMRIWTDKVTQKTVEAKYIKVEDGKVMLELESGKKAFVPLERLSDIDAVYVKNQQQIEKNAQELAERKKESEKMIAEAKKKTAELQKQLQKATKGSTKSSGNPDLDYERAIAEANRARQQAQDNANKAFNDQFAKSNQAFGQAMNQAQKQFQEDLKKVAFPKWKNVQRINLNTTEGSAAAPNAAKAGAKNNANQKPAPAEWSFKFKKAPASASFKTPAKIKVLTKGASAELQDTLLFSKLNPVGLLAFPIEPVATETHFAFVDLTGKKPPRNVTVPGSYRILALSPTGNFILASQTRARPTNGLEIWKPTATGIEKIRLWDPTEPTQVPKAFTTDWATFTDDYHLVTKNDQGRIYYWDLNKMEATMSIDVEATSKPPLVNGANNLMIVPTSSSIHVIDLSKSTVIGKQSIAEGENYFALSPSGEKLAIGNSSKVDFIDLASGKITSTFDDRRALTFVDSATWTNEKNVLLDDKHLLDVNAKKIVWSYEGIEKPFFVEDDLCWFIFHAEPMTATLVPCRLPHLEAMPTVGTSRITDGGIR